MAAVLNLCRRHLGPEQRTEVGLELRAKGWSTPRIAQVLGVDTTTVLRDLERSGYANAQPEHVTGSDAKTYPSAKPTPETLNARQERVKEAKAEGASVREIAKAEGVSVGTVAADLARPAVVSVLGATRAAEAGSLLDPTS